MFTLAPSEKPPLKPLRPAAIGALLAHGPDIDGVAPGVIESHISARRDDIHCAAVVAEPNHRAMSVSAKSDGCFLLAEVQDRVHRRDNVVPFRRFEKRSMHASPM